MTVFNVAKQREMNYFDRSDSQRFRHFASQNRHFGISVIFFLQIVEGTVGRYVHISTTHHANVALTRSIYLVTNVVRVSHMQLPKQHQPNINEAKLKKSVIQNEKTLEKRPS